MTNSKIIIAHNKWSTPYHHNKIKDKKKEGESEIQNKKKEKRRKKKTCRDNK